MDYSEDGGSILLQNADTYTGNYRASYPEDWNLHKITYWDSICKIKLHDVLLMNIHTCFWVADSDDTFTTMLMSCMPQSAKPQSCKPSTSIEKGFDHNHAPSSTPTRSTCLAL